MKKKNQFVFDFAHKMQQLNNSKVQRFLDKDNIN